MDAQRVALDVPVDHDAPPTVADMPLRGEVLIPRAVVFGVGRTGSRATAPNGRIAGMQGAIGDGGDRTAHSVHIDVAASQLM